MKWTNALRESSKKNSQKLNAASHNNASWYTDTDGLLEHSPNGASLYYKGYIFQKIIPVWGAPLMYVCVCMGSSTNNTPFLLQKLLLQNCKYVIL